MHVSRSMMIKAKNMIMKERTWINRVAQRDVTNVNRSGEWFNKESRNLVPGDLVKLTLGGLIPVVVVSKSFLERYGERLLSSLKAHSTSTSGKSERLFIQMSKKSG